MAPMIVDPLVPQFEPHLHDPMSCYVKSLPIMHKASTVLKRQWCFWKYLLNVSIPSMPLLYLPRVWKHMVWFQASLKYSIYSERQQDDSMKKLPRLFDWEGVVPSWGPEFEEELNENGRDSCLWTTSLSLLEGHASCSSCAVPCTKSYAGLVSLDEQ